MKIGFHRHGRDAAEFYDTFSVNWHKALRGPGWGAAAITIDRMHPWDRPNSSDWVTIEYGGVLRFFGRVTDTPWAASRNEANHLEVAPIMLQAVGFMDSTTDAVVTPARGGESIGTLFGADAWLREAEQFTAQCIDGNLGLALKTATKLLMSERPPKSINPEGLTLGELITVVYDDETAKAAGVPGPHQAPYGYSAAGVRATTRLSSKAIQFLIGTFQPTEELVELTAMIVDNGDPTTLKGALVFRYRFAPFRPQGLSEARVDPAFVGSSPPAQTQTVNNALSAREAVFERKTWNELPIHDAWPVAIDSVISGSRDVTATTVWESQLGSGTATNLVEELGLPILDGERTDRDGLRLTRLSWPFFPQVGDDGKTQLDAFAYSQLLAASLYQFQAPGRLFESGVATLALYDPEWEPGTRVRFLIGGRELIAYITAVEHTVTGEPDSKVSGVTKLHFSRGLWDERLRLVPVPITIIEEAATATSTTAGPTRCHDGKPSQFSGYDVYGYASWAAYTLDMPLLTAAVTPTRITPAPVQVALPAIVNGVDFPLLEVGDYTGRHEAPVYTGKYVQTPAVYEFDGFTNVLVTPASVRPAFKPGLPSLELPKGLLFWAQNARFTRHWRENEPRPVTSRGSSSDPRPTLMSVIDFERERELSHALMCVGYVIELYWRQVYPTCRLKVQHHIRAGDPPHDTGQAMDFYIEAPEIPGRGHRVSHLRLWASLRFLAQHGRIPYGSRGLYLNTSAAGITGLSQLEAGDPTTETVHYDLGGRPPNADNALSWFGASNGASNRGGEADSWLWVDPNGRGTSTFATGTRPANAPASDQKIYGARVWSAEAWNNNTGLSAAVKSVYSGSVFGGVEAVLDLPPVSNSVPNMLQLLGEPFDIPESCFRQELL